MNSIKPQSISLALTFCIFAVFSGSLFAQTESTGKKKLENSEIRETKSINQVDKRKENSLQTPQVGVPDNYNNPTSESKDARVLPADFPKFIDSGKPEADAVDYKERKMQWIKENPEKYAELTKGSHKAGDPSSRITPLVQNKKPQ